MKKLLIIPAFLTIALFGFLFTMMITILVYKAHKDTVHTAAQNQTIYAALPTAQNNFSTEIIAIDGREEAIRQFFARFDSPLEPYAGDVVAAADQYKLDFRLIPAIAMQESNLCKKIPENSFNCWGYGIYGGNVIRFKDYREGIYTVSKSLGTKYKGNGLVTPAQIEEVYTPPSEGSWAYGVNHFMDQLE